MKNHYCECQHSIFLFPVGLISLFIFTLAAVLSKVTKMADSDGILTSELGHKHTINIPASSPFRWYVHVSFNVHLKYAQYMYTTLWFPYLLIYSLYIYTFFVYTGRYLREEKLEVQVWVSYSYNHSQRPQPRDKLIGTAYISLETLADKRRTQHRVRWAKTQQSHPIH